MNVTKQKYIGNGYGSFKDKFEANLEEAYGEEDDEDKILNREILEIGINKIGKKISKLIEALNEGISSARRSAAWSLGEIGGPLAIETLEKALEIERNSDVQKAIEWALKKIRRA